MDDYVTGVIVHEDDALRMAVSESARAGLPEIAVSPPQGKLLHLLARVHHARAVLELGTLGGYSTIWLARALPREGRVVTLELQERFAEVARATSSARGSRISSSSASARRSTRCASWRGGRWPFDLVFIDADKQSTPEYFTEALQLTRAGAVIVVDNSVRDGGCADPDTEDPGARGMRRFHEMLAAGGERFSATTIQTVGSKGHDGFTLVLLA